MSEYTAIVLGDSFNNTLGLIRSLGKGGIDQRLILIGEQDRLFVSRSKYLNKGKVFKVRCIEDSLDILKSLTNSSHRQVIICTNDIAATFVDAHEEELSLTYLTPMRGRHLGDYMNKDMQCQLAQACGFDVPQSIVYHRGNPLPEKIGYPLLLKPLVSIQGEKSDIHICNSLEQVETALQANSYCKDFLMQEYIEKEYEINLIGISTDWGILIPGGIRKIRHYPTIYSPCSYGLYESIDKLDIDIRPVQKFMSKVGYRGPFSVELLHKGNRNYFMEVNFRNDGLAYAATAAGANLAAIYMQFAGFPTHIPVKDTYMMDLSIDYCHVKDGNLTFRQWFADFRRTGCQLNFNRHDVMPTICYYWNKVKRRLGLHS